MFTFSAVGLGLSLFSLPFTMASPPAGRWGHQSVYVPGHQAMYVIGGQVVEANEEITNDVLILPLNQDNPSFLTGPTTGLPPHAFASATLAEDGNSIIVVGGMTSNCGSDAVTHTLGPGSNGWTAANPTRLVRRRGAAATWVDNGSSQGAIMVVGGISDHYVCSSATYTYPVSDILSLPLGTGSMISSRNLPTDLTGSDLAISDFALAHAPDHSLYLVAGQDSTGALVSLDTIGMWTKANGWQSQSTTGQVPSGRLGATLVAHPSLDLLVLHGGSNPQSEGSATDGSSLLAVLNTTSWVWSSPSNLQPPASTGAAYHTSIMTPSGVMIIAFGLSPDGVPRSDVFYLDARGPSISEWTWKSSWSADMLDQYTVNNSSNSTNVGVAATSPTETKSDMSAPSSEKTTTTIVVPVVVGILLIVPVLLFFIRRQVRINRKRRMAKHFSFSAQDDDGDFTRPVQPVRLRRTDTQFSFGRDANEKEGNAFTDIVSAVKRIARRNRSDSTSSNAPGAGGSMRKTSRLNEKSMKWEEIDFGLGKVDQNRSAPPSRNPSISTGPTQRPPSSAGVASTCSSHNPFSDDGEILVPVGTDSSPRVGTPTDDGQAHLVPGLELDPGSMTPTQPVDNFHPSQTDGLDWNMLAQELQIRPAFRSIDPSSTLRSHAHTETLSPRTPTSPSINRVVLQPGHGRRVSETLPLNVHNPHLTRLSGSPRAVSSPLGGRTLVDMGRRGSAPSINIRPVTPSSPGSSGTVTPTNRVVSYDSTMRRASNPMVIPVSGFDNPSISGRETPSRLRVMNYSDSDYVQPAPGMAL
ncbi:hypothetical protein BD324DRAFT_680689 [Kockovaella imperatae]|uniref:Galactose oxidase n=1 Tax=Kockovaella imperatae TaxID=4999 RepID=A0A1Y1UII7_9TREE|nr:hypothetical protein BD324DRAFT_680689 [Kockovaella imperatae]ORX37809.1 hypothetical protein BD324DRAFT_680689 [Kockovaella imperatae]